MTVHLGLLDLAILGISLVVVVLIGLRASRQTRDLESYLLGDRDLPWWAILGSIVATETSTATVLSVPGLAYGPTGMRFLQLALGYILGRLIVVRLLLPLYFQGKLFTAYQVLDQRFGAATKRAASVLFLVTRNLGDGLRLYLAALVIGKLTGWSLAGSIVVMGVVTILYTCFGGLRSVVWNDCIQFVIYMFGAVVTIFLISTRLPGGWDELIAFGQSTGRFQVFNFQFSLDDAFTIWAGLIGGAVLTIGTHGTDHMMVQRYLSARSQPDAGRAVLMSGFVVFIQFSIFLLIGIQLACYYSHRPEVVFQKNDEVFVHFIVHEFPQNTGLVGLMLAAVLAAAMSTLSSSLNASASSCMSDLLLPALNRQLTPGQELGITRGLTVAFGLVQIGIAIASRNLTDMVVTNALAIAGFSAGLLLGVFLLGVLTRTVGQSAALAGAALGLLTLLCVVFVLPVWGIKVAWPWLALIGSSVTFAGGSLFSAVISWKGES